MRQWWAEIRRRHVLRVAAYYIAGAWVLAQAGDLLFDAFDESGYTRFLIAGLVLGLPVALVLAWIFDITPRGIERTLALGRSAPETPLPAVEAPANSIAVLPFANLSRDPANEYFSDGLAEEIRNELARVEGLRVAARTSSFAFKGRHEDVREIGRRLNVAALLEGGVRREADTVRIDVQLVSTRDGFQVWSQRFERRLDDVFVLQSDVSSAVIAAVSERQGLEIEGTRAPCEPRNFEAYNAYLLGRHHFHQRTEASLQRAAETFQRAIALDPDYAVAHTGLADTWMFLSVRYYGNLALEQALGHAQPAVDRALALAPQLAEAHASLGLLRMNRGDLAGAVESLQQAVTLDPGYSMGHVWLGLALLAQGRYEDAAARNLLVYRQDPLSPIVVTNAAFDALRFGRDEEARARFEGAIELNPQFPVPYSGLSRLNAVRGRLNEAMVWIDRAIDVAPTRAFYRARRGLLCLQLGDLAGAADAIAAASVRAPDNVFDAELVIALHVAQRDRAALERIAHGTAGRAYGPAQQAAAWMALGEHSRARDLYERTELSFRAEIDEILNDDWVWRLPHWITRAHLRLQAGDEAAGRADLQAYVDAATLLAAQGIVSGDVRYWAVTARVLLGQVDEAASDLRTAIAGGWSHGWWARLDWNMAGVRDDARLAAMLASTTSTTT